MFVILTVQEDTYEAVKTNVYDMMAQVASHFSPDQLDMLFSKLQPNKERSLLDTLKLAELLKRLAASDSEVSASLQCGNSEIACYCERQMSEVCLSVTTCSLVQLHVAGSSCVHTLHICVDCILQKVVCAC
jgi:hypothetical protein